MQGAACRGPWGERSNRYLRNQQPIALSAFFQTPQVEESSVRRSSTTATMGVGVSASLQPHLHRRGSRQSTSHPTSKAINIESAYRTAMGDGL